MDVSAVHITDDEFARLMGMNMIAFATRFRAETVADDLKRRIGSVAQFAPTDRRR